jgi:hypothetical protein
MEKTETNDNDKKILISGTNNRYLIKRANRIKNEIKKREVINKYNLNPIFLNHDKQINLIKEIYSNHNQDENNLVKNILKQEIEKKLSSYRHQDLIKNKYNESLFLDIDTIMQKLIDTSMQCFYCNCPVVILYEIVRELTQWTIDRIDNDNGHNKDNFVIACLNCNIKRRNINSNKFLFTKQLNLIKTDR